MRKLPLCMLVTVLGLWVYPVMAYIDPGSGSAIMSAIIGFFVAIGLFVKTYWYKIKSLFTGNKNNQVPEDDETSGLDK